MKTPIEAILFDIGGTLRYTERRTGAEKEEILAQIMTLIGAEEAAEAFSQKLAERASAYKRWSEETCLELNEAELWQRWMLPDYPPPLIRERAIEINQLYRSWLGRRVPFAESRDVIVELFRRGYRLGVVSNTTSSVEVPELLRQLEISGCFETVLLSAVSGTRKPCPSILLEAAQRMGVAPENCTYIGDRVDRDVAAARAAGFAQAVIIDPSAQTGKVGEDLRPDQTVPALGKVLELFPPRPAPQPEAVYDAALSTMYAVHQFPALTDFFEFARRTGFAYIELNHKVTSAMLEGIPLRRFPIRSIHEPCPADISEGELKKRGWLISSTDEACRKEGVRAMRRSIELASRVGAEVIVIHAGEAVPDVHQLERKLRNMIHAGQGGSDRYRSVQAEMIAIRKQHAPAGLEAVRKSLQELLEYAYPHNIRLGLENRYHYLEFPSPDELESLLTLAGPEQIGFLYDIGHAYTLDTLGFYAHTEWLERFSSRLIETHLHDVRETTDHFAPGLGTVDFQTAAAYLPQGAFRTCELQTTNSPEEVKTSLRLLAEQGCIRKIS